MDLLPHDTDDVFSLRFYDKEDGPAEEQYGEQRDFRACCMVTMIDDRLAVVKLALSQVRLNRRIVIATCRRLDKRGVEFAVISRSSLHGGVPLAKPIEEGILAGKLFWDVKAILAGADGDY